MEKSTSLVDLPKTATTATGIINRLQELQEKIKQHIGEDVDASRLANEIMELQTSKLDELNSRLSDLQSIKSDEEQYNTQIESLNKQILFYKDKVEQCKGNQQELDDLKKLIEDIDKQLNEVEKTAQQLVDNDLIRKLGNWVFMEQLEILKQYPQKL
jgi:DNA repair exonuclease SbcCD ATPase subunit